MIQIELIYIVFVYLLIGLIHQLLISLIHYRIVKRMKEDLIYLESNSSIMIIIEVLFWPVFVIKRMIKYEEMKQTLKFVEEKLDAYYSQENQEKDEHTQLDSGVKEVKHESINIFTNIKKAIDKYHKKLVDLALDNVDNDLDDELILESRQRNIKRSS